MLWLARTGAVLLAMAYLAALSVSSVAQAQQNDPFGANWPAGDGRALTGAFCGGCHSLNLVRQQGLSRERWDELLHWMTEQQNMPPLEGDRRETVLDFLAAHFGPGQAGARGTLDADRLPAPFPVQGIEREPLGIPAED